MANPARITPAQRWILGVLLAGFVFACIRFALVQDIWIDESTQLSGVRLPIAELLRWLSGSQPYRFGVPGDRMPPLAYLLDHAWWVASGDAATRFRLFHVALTIIGVALLARIEIAALGRQWWGIGVAFLVLSPKLIETSVELRSYPLFFTLTCALFLPFLRIVQRCERLPAWSDLALFGGGCIVLSYVHFFGVVASFSFFATLMLAFCRTRAALLRVMIVGAGVGLCLLGLYPFIFGASAISTAGPPAAAGGIASYLPLLLGHSALLIYPAAAVLYFGGAGLLLLAAAWGAARRAVRRRSQPLDWLLPVAAIGVVATIAPGLLISSFSALKPSYSIWLLPVFALLIALGAGKPIGWPVWDRFGRIGAVAALLAGAAIGTGVFLIEAPWFVHGPHRLIAAARAASPPATAVLYAESSSFAYGYFPMVYDSSGQLPQWLASGSGVARLSAAGTAPIRPIAALATYQGLVVVDIRPRHYTDLRQCPHACPDFATPAVVNQLVREGHWAIATQSRAFGFYDAEVFRLMPAAVRQATPGRALP